MFYITVFLIPGAFVIALGAILALVLSASPIEWLLGLGWDSHVLAWGALGGVFSNAGINQYFRNDGEVGIAELTCVAVLLLLAAAALAIRKPAKNTDPGGWRGLGALAVGGFSLGIPFAVAFLSNMK